MTRRIDNASLGQYCFYCGHAFPRMYTTDDGRIVCKPGPECRKPLPHSRVRRVTPQIRIRAMRELANYEQRDAYLICSHYNKQDVFLSVMQANDLRYNFRLTPDQAIELRDWLDGLGLPRKGA